MNTKLFLVALLLTVRSYCADSQSADEYFFRLDQINITSPGKINSYALSGDGNKLAVATKNAIAFYALQEGKYVELETHKFSQLTCKDLVFNPANSNEIAFIGLVDEKSERNMAYVFNRLLKKRTKHECASGSVEAIGYNMSGTIFADASKSYVALSDALHEVNYVLNYVTDLKIDKLVFLHDAKRLVVQSSGKRENENITTLAIAEENKNGYKIKSRVDLHSRIVDHLVTPNGNILAAFKKKDQCGLSTILGKIYNTDTDSRIEYKKLDEQVPCKRPHALYDENWPFCIMYTQDTEDAELGINVWVVDVDANVAQNITRLPLRSMKLSHDGKRIIGECVKKISGHELAVYTVAVARLLMAKGIVRAKE